jgi:hypothetical protein
MAVLFKFDGEAIPGNPARGYLEASEQLVDSARNANGQVVAQKINRRLRKFDSLKWPYLSRAQVNWLKKKVANFTVNLTYYDSEDGGIVTRKFYFGDMTAEPCDWDRSGEIMIPTYYTNVSVNIIDMRILKYPKL